MGVEVAQQEDLGAVVDDLTVDVQHEGGERFPGKGLERTDGPGQCLVVESGDTCDPAVVLLVELRQCRGGVAPIAMAPASGARIPRALLEAASI